MSDQPSAPLADGTDQPVVERRAELVIQGLCGTYGSGWRDVERMTDCAYARSVYPSRLVEYQRGDCAAASMQFAEFRIVRRETLDRTWMPNVRLDWQEEAR